MTITEYFAIPLKLFFSRDLNAYRKPREKISHDVALPSFKEAKST